MLRDSYLLQIHRLLKHDDNLQHSPDDDLSMLPFSLFCLLMETAI